MKFFPDWKPVAEIEKPPEGMKPKPVIKSNVKCFEELRKYQSRHRL
jgi:hypothetical protein